MGRQYVIYKIKVTVTLTFILTFMFVKVCTHCVLSRTFVPRIIKLGMWMHYGKAMCCATNVGHFYLRSVYLIVECNPLMEVSRLMGLARLGSGGIHSELCSQFLV